MLFLIVPAIVALLYLLMRRGSEEGGAVTGNDRNMVRDENQMLAYEHLMSVIVEFEPPVMKAEKMLVAYRKSLATALANVQANIGYLEKVRDDIYHKNIEHAFEFACQVKLLFDETTLLCETLSSLIKDITSMKKLRLGDISGNSQYHENLDRIKSMKKTFNELIETMKAIYARGSQYDTDYNEWKKGLL